MNKYDAIYGALVADAAGLGLHWLYDPDQIESLSQQGELLFRAPDPLVYTGKRGVFVHTGKLTGDLSHYGESARLVSDIVFNEPYTTSAHQQLFYDAFGPCGYFVGYADKPTKQLIARIINESDDIPESSGMDDNQMPAFCVMPALVAADQSLDITLKAAKVISTNSNVLEGLTIAHQCAELLKNGEPLQKALMASVEDSDGEISQLLKQSLKIEHYDPVAIGETFGRACYVHHALPVAWHLLNSAQDFENVIRDNIRCGGDSCGRAMLIGSLAGLAFGVPETLKAKVANGVLPSKEYT